MKRAICFAAMIFAGTASAQSPSSEHESSRVTLRSTSTLVVVPTREDTAAEVAFLSGGQQIRFKDKLDLERPWSILTTDIPSRYTLSFRPASKRPGFHAIHVNIVDGTGSLGVTTRVGYWREEGAAK